jgi:stage II sporulation protein D
VKTARFLILAAVCSVLAKAERDITPSVVKIRMVKIPTDLRVRLLLARIPMKSLESFSISGFRLRDSEGRLVPSETVTCGSEKVAHPQKIVSRMTPTGQWICRAGKTYSVKVKEGLRFVPEGGFIEFAGRSYRGGIELAPLETQIQIVNAVEIEKYLVGLLTKEMNPDFPAEALKAQAVAARSYALARVADQRRIGKKWDLTVTPDDQVYKGAHTEDPRTLAAVNATLGEALFFRDEVITAYYHASSGGYLEIPDNLWGKTELVADRLAYTNQENPWDKKALEWNASISPEFGTIWSDIGRLKDVKVLEYTSGKRVNTLVLEGEVGRVVLQGNEIRKRFGSELIRSLNFQLESLGEGQGWKITGRGWGHGVGLSQWAAKAMAEAGMSYKSILKFHYPFADVKSWIPRKAAMPPLQELAPIPPALAR